MAVIGDFSYSVQVPGMPAIPTPTPPNIPDPAALLIEAGASLLPAASAPLAPVRSFLERATSTRIQTQPAFLRLAQPAASSFLDKAMSKVPASGAAAPAPMPVYDRAVRMSAPEGGVSPTMIAAGVAAIAVAFFAFRKR